MSQLFLDLDGVLGDFDRACFDRFGIVSRRNQPDPPGFNTLLRTDKTFFLTMPLMPDAMALWQAVAHLRPIILTGLPQSNPDVADHKRLWVSKHFGPEVCVICCLSRDKRDHGRPGDVLVDDWHRYRQHWIDMGGVFVLHTDAASTLVTLRAHFALEKP